ncbi:MAG: MFS transporter [SAR202 cluster bacterium]|nr:MFS transporter [SAR202 cluster bacterium]
MNTTKILSLYPKYFFDNLYELFSINDYKYLVVANITMFAGYQIRVMALAWIVLDLTQSETSMGLINSISGIGVIGMSLFGGAFSDRFERWKLLWMTKLSVAIISIITGILLSMNIINENTVWILIPLSLIIGIIFGIHNPSSQTFVVDVVGKEKLVQAVSFNTSASTIAQIVAPSLGGLLIWLGYDISFYFISSLYILGALMIISVKTRSKKKNHKVKNENLFIEIKTGIIYSLKNPIIRPLLIISITAIFGGMYQPVIPVKIKNDLGLEELHYGYTLAASGVGALFGSIILFTLGSRVRNLYVLIISFIGFDIGVIIFGFAPNFLISILSSFMMGTGFACWMVTVPVMLQQYASDEMRGRVVSLYYMTILTYQLGWFFGGYILEKTSIEFSVLFSSLSSILIAIITIISAKELRKL